MALLTASDADRGLHLTGPCAAGAGCRRVQRHRGRSSAGDRLLVALFVGLQIADIVSTNYALAMPGSWEANPVMALAQDRLGAVWWLPKLALAALVCCAAPLARRRAAMIFAVFYYLLLVTGNLARL